MRKTVAVTGASGYVGGLAAEALAAVGYRVLTLGRRPDDDALFSLGSSAPPPSWFTEQGVTALVHAAWDFRHRDPRFVFARNVVGSEALLRSAAAAGVHLVHLSSMSAWEGCPSVYGRGKRAVERLVLQLGGLNLRVGLVLGDPPGGMVGSMLRLARLPVVFVPDTPAPVYVVSEYRFVIALLRAVVQTEVGQHNVHDEPARTLPDLVRTLAPRRQIVPVPWRLPWAALRLAEACGLSLRAHSDSLLSLSRAAPAPPLHAAQAPA